jgi:histidine ammonia-lyase
MMMLELTGQNLSIKDLTGLPKHGPLNITLGPNVQSAMINTIQHIAMHTSKAYGRSTGVGANRNVAVETDDDGHGLRLIRSHAYDTGESLPEAVVRVAMVVRVNQLAQARSGLRPEVLTALVSACNDGLSPTVGRTSSLGVGDVAMFAAVGLALMGERPWSDGTKKAYLNTFHAEDALAFISTNAALIAQAALITERIEQVLYATHIITALTHVALRGNPEAYDANVHAARPHPGIIHSAALMRELLEGTGPPARVQDPLSLRCSPQVHGAALTALEDLKRDLTIELNAATENPIYLEGLPYHHGGFHNALLALDLDRLRLALLQVADLSVARLNKLHEPTLTDQKPFLAYGPASASGTMMLEYTAISALAEVRSSAHPASGASASFSRGLEDHASFAWLSALQVDRLQDSMMTVLACELLAAVRSLHLEGPERVIPETLQIAAHSALSLQVIADDHELTSHIVAARNVVETLLSSRGI